MIEFQEVAVHFGTQDVLTDVNLRVSAGERIGIVGPNGAGKSTLFQGKTQIKKQEKYVSMGKAGNEGDHLARGNGRWGR